MRCGEGSERLGRSWDRTRVDRRSSLVSQLGSRSKGGGEGSLRVVCGQWVLATSEGFCSVKVSSHTRVREADKHRGGGSESS